jgi:hypothetical protein
MHCTLAIKQLNDEMAEFQKQRQQAEAAFEQV